jgi:hypothetical protein
MHKTKHFEKRLGQRGISKAMIELVLNYGKDAGDKVVLDRRSAQKLIEDFRTLMKIVDKGGVTVVAQGEALITAYNFEGRGH